MGENPVHNPNTSDASDEQDRQQPIEAPSYPPSPGSQPHSAPYGQAPYGQAYGQSAVKQQTTNTLAIVSFVSSFFVSLAGVITGHIALSQIKRTGEQGRGFALAGLIIGYVMMAFTAVVIIIAIVFSIAAGVAVSESVKSAEASPQTQRTAPNSSLAPENLNAFGGITFGTGGRVVPPSVRPGEVDLSALPQNTTDLSSIGIKASASGEPVQAVVYVDFLCPHCADFESQQGPALQALLEQGKMTLEYRPVAFLDRFSVGSEYSSRSAEAAACVAATAPEKYQSYLEALFTNQPAMNKKAPDTTALTALATAAGAGDIDQCLTGLDMVNLVSDATLLALDHGVSGTPTVYLDGQQWEEGTFPAFVQTVLNTKK